MKYLSKITLGLVLCTGLIASCKDDETGIPGGIVVDKEEITIAAEGGTEKVAVSANANWVASASKPWIAISPANGLGSAECSLAIDSTLENTSRTAQVRFAMEGQEPKMITITQFGYGKQILIKEPDIEIENSAVYDKRYFEATISTNVNFEIGETVDYSFANAESMTDEDKKEFEPEKANWITMPKEADLKVNLDRKARPRTIKVRFRWNMNTTPYARVAKIRLVSQKPEEDQLVDDKGNPINEVILTVTQKPALKIEDNRAGDSLAIITINEKVQSMMSFDTSENMQNWSGVTLWEATDKDLPEGAVGRVRSVKFVMIDLKDGETLPKEIRYLKYLESFSIQSNANWQIRDVSLGEEICELKYLKSLSAYAYGMNKLPDNFIKLGGNTNEGYKGLETLNLASNGFPKLSDVTNVVNQQNFPKLATLSLTGCRRVDIIKDLSEITADGKYNGREVGLRINLNDAPDKKAFLKLMTWDNLRDLSLSYNFIEGKLPTDDEMESALNTASKQVHYTEDDFFTKEQLTAKPAIYLDKLSVDTCSWLKTSDNEVTFKEVGGTTLTTKGNEVLRVLPKARTFSFNLNYLTGPLPKWILFHPYFVGWYPEVLVFTQENDVKNTAKESVGFSNIDAVKFDYSYYYGDKDYGEKHAGVAYPLYYRKYVANTSTDTSN